MEVVTIYLYEYRIDLKHDNPVVRVIPVKCNKGSYGAYTLPYRTDPDWLASRTAVRPDELGIDAYQMKVNQTSGWVYHWELFDLPQTRLNFIEAARELLHKRLKHNHLFALRKLSRVKNLLEANHTEEEIIDAV